MPTRWTVGDPALKETHGPLVKETAAMNGQSCHARSIVSVLVLTSAFAASGCGPGPVITVVNTSGADLRDVTLVYSGGKTAVGHVPAHESRRFSIAVRGESDLRLQFVDSHGAHHDELVDVYIESGDRGRLTITVQPDLKVKWKRKAWLPG